MDLFLVKIVHVTCVAASYTLFFLRGVWLIKGSPIMSQRWVKVVPHITDTLLLASAVALAIGMRQYPGTDSWLTAKVVGLLLYIGLGMVAFRFSKTLRARVVSWVAAQLVFFYIVAVALAHSPLPFFAQ
jgi:uncharacterized membrane protein SirB2